MIDQSIISDNTNIIHNVSIEEWILFYKFITWDFIGKCYKMVTYLSVLYVIILFIDRWYVNKYI